MLKKKYDLILTVWGSVYTDLFLNVCLPSLLAPGNLPFLQKNGECRLVVYTRSSDEPRFRQSPVFKQLVLFMRVDFKLKDEMLDTQSAWFSMATCQNDAIRAARERNAYIVFVIPDFVYSDDSFKKLADLAEKGYKGILVFQLGAMRDSFVESYRARYYNDADCTAALSSRELIGLWREHQHPTSNFFLWSSRHFPNDLTSLFGWENPDGSFAVRSAQLTPFLLLPETDYLLPTDEVAPRSLDTVLTKYLVKDPEDVYIIRNSHEAVQVEMRPRSEPYSVLFDRPNIPMIACFLNWFREHGNGNVDYLEQAVGFYPDGQKAVEPDPGSSSALCYALIKDMSCFSSVEEFVLKVKKYFEDCIKGRPVAIIGRGYLADITSDFLIVMGINNRMITNVCDLRTGEFVFLVAAGADAEMLCAHLATNGMAFERDFQLTPLMYRHFRKLIRPKRSWKSFYYDYYLPVRKHGFLWLLQVLRRKFIIFSSRFLEGK